MKKNIRQHTLTLLFLLSWFACAAQERIDTVVLGTPMSDSMQIQKPNLVDTVIMANDRTDAQETKTYTDEYLDTVKVSKRFVLNDYSLIGVEYGVSANRMMFSPSMKQSTQIRPGTVGIFYIKYGKMFGYLPYFGYKVGFRYTTEGFKMKKNKETGITRTVMGAEELKMDMIEIPAMAHFHVDMLHFKLMADLGIYAGYRLNVERIGDYVADSIKTSFADTDRRFDFGVVGGIGFGIVFDPIEFHVNANLRYSWGTLYDPDYYSEYYYRFAYPLNVMVSAGVYFQLTRRNGKSKAQIRREAYDSVYNPAQTGTL